MVDKLALVSSLGHGELMRDLASYVRVPTDPNELTRRESIEASVKL